MIPLHFQNDTNGWVIRFVVDAADVRHSLVSYSSTTNRSISESSRRNSTLPGLSCTNCWDNPVSQVYLY